MSFTSLLSVNNKSASWFGALFFVLAFAATTSSAETVPPAAAAVEIGVSAMRFDYAEYKDDGSVWDKELGGIPGLSFKFTQRLPAWEWETTASYHYGRVNYTGQSNSGMPYNTRTDEGIGDIALRAGHWLDGRWMPYAGLGYRRWDRNILPGTLGGLYESYRWPYAWLGAKFVAVQDARLQLVLDAGLLQPINPEMHVDLSATYNVSPVLYPESKTGLRMVLTSTLKISANSRLTLEPYFEYWELGRSPTITTGSITLYEPASKTTNLGFNFRYGQVF